MAAALRRLVLPSFSRRLASCHPIPSFTGTGKATQGRLADKWTSLRSYMSEAAAHEERKERLMYEIARADLLLDLSVVAGAALFGYTFYLNHNQRVETASSRLSDVRLYVEAAQKSN